MTAETRRLTVLFAALVAILAGLAAAAGIFLRGDLATTEFVTFRGDHVKTLAGGVYRFNDLSIASEGVGWDAVTLLLAVPGLLLALPGLLRGSLRSQLVAAGFLAYFLYQYLEYAAFLAYGPLFLIYVATFSLSIVALVLLVGSIDVAALPTRFGDGFPRRGVVALGALMAVLLTGMWLPLVARTMTQASVPELYGSTTLVVQAFDLGFLVPLGIFTAIAAHRRLAWGYLLAGVITIKGMTMALAIVAMMTIESITTGTLMLPPIVIFGLVATLSALVGWRVFGSIDRSARVGLRTHRPAIA